ncbi:hypothetical protein F5B22DRAFT_502772 [Xylaria bambusicola]|uniref:uncharacterized protein n=1 Tax=Xylaria bambusicola TaxID=326684 RepID=UPI0020081880|nr:uncharacterized protein F5B22DRAFT_502772 [Xylaria bambusicola]KAI0521798.1 hypothetical protein F5B22DRAFT_502772 [Xylaria bambusicola]
MSVESWKLDCSSVATAATLQLGWPHWLLGIASWAMLAIHPTYHPIYGSFHWNRQSSAHCLCGIIRMPIASVLLDDRRNKMEPTITYTMYAGGNRGAAGVRSSLAVAVNDMCSRDCTGFSGQIRDENEEYGLLQAVLQRASRWKHIHLHLH